MTSDDRTRLSFDGESPSEDEKARILAVLNKEFNAATILGHAKVVLSSRPGGGWTIVEATMVPGAVGSGYFHEQHFPVPAPPFDCSSRVRELLRAAGVDCK